jgi:tetratricopeptide (TPR) repeat protein
MASDSTRITRSGTVLGTAAYMAPEQLEGREPGPSVDIYALAAVCYETLAGRRPRDGKTPVEIAHAISSGPPPDLRDHWPAASPGVAEALRRGMARDPAERPASAGQLAGELAHALEEEPRTAVTRRLPRRAAPAPVAAPPAEPPTRPPARRVGDSGHIRAEKRHSLPYVVAGLLMLLVLAVVGVVLASGGDDGGGGTQDTVAQQPQRERAQQDKKQRSERRQAQAAPAPAPEPEAEEAPAEPAPAPEPEPDPQEEAPAEQPTGGADLNQQGFDLMNQGRYEEAIPVLQRAVDALGESGSLDYAYALYNLGRSLRLAGRPTEAIPVLEQRLAIPNQRGIVKRELDAARREAGQG